MGKALQVISGRVATPSTTYTKLTPDGSDLFAVNDYAPGSKAYMLNAWADIDDGGSIRVRSPNFHDDVNGIQLVTAAHSPIPLMDNYSKQILQSNDTLTFELKDSSGGALSAATMLHYYENLPGADAALYDWPTVDNLIAELMSCRVALTLAGTDGDYEGSIAMTALENLFKADGRYALLGYQCSTQLTTVGVTGTDTSNRRVGGPGTSPDVYDTRDWFVQQSLKSGYPCIPVYRTQNLQSTSVDAIDTESHDSAIVEFMFARLMT